MKVLRFVGLLLFVSLMCFSAIAQDSPTASKEEKEKARAELEKNAARLIEQIVGDTALLKLPENRAVVYANAADLLWKTDDKRARTLFRQSADEIVLAQTEADKSDNASSPFASLQSTEPRSQILQMIAKRDADLALDLLVSTRSAKLVAEMQKAAAAQNAQPVSDTNDAAGMMRWESKFLVESELRLEQSFATLAAENNPQRAIKLIRESLSKGVSSEVLALLKKLNEKDSEAANSLAAEVSGKLLSSDFAKRDTDKQTAFAFLQTFSTAPKEDTKTDTTQNVTNKKPLKVDDKLLKDLANKLIDDFLQSKNFVALFQIGAMTSTLEKIVPERMAQVKQKQAALKKTAPPEMADFEGLSSLGDPNAKPEDMIKGAAKLPAMVRGQVYKQAVNKLIEAGDLERAKSVIADIPAGADRDKAQALIDSKLAEKAVKDGKFDEARKIIGKISDKNSQTEQLVKLALAFHEKNTKESKEIALSVMSEARRAVDDTPQNEDEINALLAIVAGYALIKPDQSFAILSPLLDQTNDLIQAAALLSKFNKRDRRFRNGEMSFVRCLGQMSAGMSRYSKELGLLAASDFERTRSLADKLQRPDAQILARLLIAQSVLSDKIGVGSGNRFLDDPGESIILGDE